MFPFYTEEQLVMRLTINDPARNYYFLILGEDKILSPKIDDMGD
ncbi:hypothetical protein EYZ11_009019 [Aspergillus tanneri]|uniref:Uncharacterized protein n=1 Tax=Aspergillus tanneri TaxID=1220188 RepID=A0A4S3JEF5_9EURO|nr:hypothetical protein EYZ11_009019 [Aspergillus tanneri]